MVTVQSNGQVRLRRLREDERGTVELPMTETKEQRQQRLSTMEIRVRNDGYRAEPALWPTSALPKIALAAVSVAAVGVGILAGRLHEAATSVWGFGIGIITGITALSMKVHKKAGKAQAARAQQTESIPLPSSK